jgi:hypothetical protein
MISATRLLDCYCVAYINQTGSWDTACSFWIVPGTLED